MDQIPYFRRAVATLINFKVILKMICNDFLKVNIQQSYQNKYVGHLGHLDTVMRC